MPFNENEPYVYFNHDQSKHNVSAEEAKKFYAGAGSFRRKQQRAEKCRCPKDKWMFCDTDCENCSFCLAGHELSLDRTITDEDGNESGPLDFVPDTAALIDDAIADEEEMSALLRRLAELLPNAMKIGELRLAGKSEDEIAKIISAPRKTTAYRIQKAYEILKKEFPEKF